MIVTSSYNGKPPSNAGQFVQWLDEIQPGELEGVHYAVFGCGDHNWASTYQYVPRTIDEQLAEKGATRFLHAERAMSAVILKDSLTSGKKHVVGRHQGLRTRT